MNVSLQGPSQEIRPAPGTILPITTIQMEPIAPIRYQQRHRNTHLHICNPNGSGDNEAQVGIRRCHLLRPCSTASAPLSFHPPAHQHAKYRYLKYRLTAEYRLTHCWNHWCKEQRSAGKRRYRRPIKRILLTCDAKSSANTGNFNSITIFKNFNLKIQGFGFFWSICFWFDWIQTTVWACELSAVWRCPAANSVKSALSSPRSRQAALSTPTAKSSKVTFINIILFISFFKFLFDLLNLRWLGGGGGGIDWLIEFPNAFSGFDDGMFGIISIWFQLTGDQVLEWNGIPLGGRSFEEVQSIISSTRGEVEIVLCG